MSSSKDEQVGKNGKKARWGRRREGRRRKEGIREDEGSMRKGGEEGRREEGGEQSREGKAGGQTSTGGRCRARSMDIDRGDGNREHQTRSKHQVTAPHVNKQRAISRRMCS